MLRDLDLIDLEHAVIAGDYVRFDAAARNTLKDFRSKVLGALSGASRRPTNLLLWGLPGSGKTFLVEQVARTAGPAVRLIEANLARLHADDLRARLDDVQHEDRDVVCLVDEIDAQPDQAWPYELLLPALEPSESQRHRTIYCLAGSGGTDLEEFKRRLRARPKGPDLLSRIPIGNEFIVPALGPGDKFLVATSQFRAAAATEARELREIEKFALFYIAASPAYSSARQLRALALESARRIPPGEDRLRYDHLFSAGDPENKRFWSEFSPRYGSLAGVFVPIAGRPAAEPSAEDGRDRAAASPSTTVRSPSRVAVLPFANLSPDPQDAYFADGLTEELIGTIAAGSDAHVIARTSTMHYRGSRLTVAEIARELGVQRVVEGSVRRSGPRIRIAVQLVDARTEEQLWSSRFDREIDDIFAIQSEIAGKVASSIGAGSSSRGPAVAAPDPGAYTTYLRAVQLFRADTPESIREAIRLFDRASAEDPSLAIARVVLARSWINLALQRAEEWSVIEEHALPAAREALRIDPNLPEAHAGLAEVLGAIDRHPEAIQEAEAAISLNPGCADAYYPLGMELGTVGRLRESYLALAKGHELDPLDPKTAVCLADVAQVLGRKDDVRRLATRLRELHGGNPFVVRSVALIQDAAGERAEARTLITNALRQNPSDAALESAQAILEATAGNRQGAEHMLTALKARVNTDGYASTELQARAALGDVDAAFDALAVLAERHSWPWLVTSALVYAPLWPDTRFRAFCEKVGVPAGVQSRGELSRREEPSP